MVKLTVTKSLGPQLDSGGTMRAPLNMYCGNTAESVRVWKDNSTRQVDEQRGCR